MKSLIIVAASMLLGAAPAPSYRIVGQIAGPDGGWDLASVDPIARRVYVARSDALMAVDIATGKVTSALAPLQRGHAALAIPGTRDVLATNGTSNTAVIVDGFTGKIRATIATGTKPDAAVYDPASHHLFVMNAGSGSITVVDPVTAAVQATIPVGGSLELGAVDGHGRLYVNVEDRNDVAVIDTSSNRLIKRFPLVGCDGPTGIAYSPEARRLVSACANGEAIVSAIDGRKIAALAIGPHPDGAAYDARRHVALVPSGGDGSLSVIRLTGSPAVLGRIATGSGARTIALDSATGRAYLPSAQFLPTTGAERPTMVPGTFRLLVVAPAR